MDQPLTKAQRAFMAVLADGQDHTFNGRMERLIWRLTDRGLVTHSYAFAMPGMPARITVRRVEGQS